MWLAAICAFVLHTTPDELARAKVLYQAGKTHYQLGNYSEAIRDLAAGYALAPRPEFLVNLAQAYRGAGELAKAVSLLEKFLAERPQDPRRAEVTALIADLRTELASKAPPPPAQSDAPRREDTPAPSLTTTSPKPLVEPVAVEAKPSPLVWAIPVGVAAAVGLTLGIVFGVSSQVGCGPERTLGCVDLRSR